jgi:hypothetical protein
MCGRPATQTSNDITSVDSAPLACSRTPVTCVATSIGNVVPARGPWPTVRSDREAEVMLATLRRC